MDVNKLKKINIKNRTYEYWNDLINIYELDLINIPGDEKSYKIFLCIILYLKFHTLPLIFRKINEYIKDFKFPLTTTIY